MGYNILKICKYLKENVKRNETLQTNLHLIIIRTREKLFRTMALVVKKFCICFGRATKHKFSHRAYSLHKRLCLCVSKKHNIAELCSADEGEMCTSYYTCSSKIPWNHFIGCGPHTWREER